MNKKNWLALLLMLGLFAVDAFAGGTGTNGFSSAWTKISGFITDPDIQSIITSGLVGWGTYQWGAGGGMAKAAPYLSIAAVYLSFNDIIGGLVGAVI